jgi:hypothetical protein
MAESMNINSLSVLLGCAGLLVGGIGLAARLDQDGADGARLQVARTVNWPPHAAAAGVEFHDEMVALLTPRTPPRAPQARAQDARAQGETPESGTSIKSIRTLRAAGSRRTDFYEIEFVDAQGRQTVRRYAAEQDPSRERARQEWVPPETYGYAPRQQRRERRSRQYRW